LNPTKVINGPGVSRLFTRTKADQEKALNRRVDDESDLKQKASMGSSTVPVQFNCCCGFCSKDIREKSINPGRPRCCSIRGKQVCHGTTGRCIAYRVTVVWIGSR
jgi:hypothetical protein